MASPSDKDGRRAASKRTKIRAELGHHGVVTKQTVLASSEAVARRMSRQMSKDTLPEVLVRRALHRRGRRFRIHYRPEVSLRRTPDIVFTRAHVVVFVDGCFWHACPEHGTSPKSNGAWWAAKLVGNEARDRDTDERYRALGWTVVRVWEHMNPEDAADLIEKMLPPAGQPSSGTRSVTGKASSIDRGTSSAWWTKSS